jgi:membrane fusion protein (multidrug efflux system)
METNEGEIQAPTTLMESALSNAASQPAGMTNKRLKWVGIFVGILALGWVIQFVYTSYVSESTDDAQISAYNSELASRVGGMVLELPVSENQSVKAGDILLKIDPRDYQNRLDQARGELASAEAKLDDAAKNDRRMKRLHASGTVSSQQADAAAEAFREATGKVEAMTAAVAQAQLDLERTVVRAPEDGKVGKRSVEKGMMVSPGQALFAFVQGRDRWVTANFKETQLRRIKPGQEADVEVDAVEGRVLKGHVESFAPGSGSTFAVIPPDNASGNFVKIVQRVPVKIALDPESVHGYEDRLLPGLSAVVVIRVR